MEACGQKDTHDSLHQETDDLSALTLTGFVVKWEQNPHLMRRDDDKEAKKELF